MDHSNQSSLTCQAIGGWWWLDHSGWKFAGTDRGIRLDVIAFCVRILCLSEFHSGWSKLGRHYLRWGCGRPGQQTVLWCAVLFQLRCLIGRQNRQQWPRPRRSAHLGFIETVIHSCLKEHADLNSCWWYFTPKRSSPTRRAAFNWRGNLLLIQQHVIHKNLPCCLQRTAVHKLTKLRRYVPQAAAILTGKRISKHSRIRKI